MKKALFAVALTLGLTTAGWSDDDTAPDASPGLTVSAHYSGSVMIFQVADITISGRFTEQDYSAAARFTAAGLAALFTDADIEAGVSGYRDGATLRPWRYSHLNHASSKNRTVGIDFPDGVATPDINPPFGNMGEPPASDEERAGAADPISTLLSMALGAASGENGVCDGRLPVFDGRARYNLRFESGGTDSIRTRAWRGEAVVCHAYYEPISGYEEDEFPSDDVIAEPITMWFAPVEGTNIHVPVRIRTNAGFGGATITARSIQAH